MKHIKIIIAAAALFLLASCTFIRINRNVVSEEKNSVPPGEEVSQIGDASVFTINVPADIKYVQTPGKPYLTIMATPAIREQIVILQDGSGVPSSPGETTSRATSRTWTYASAPRR